MATQDQLEIIRAGGEIEFYDLDPARGVTNIGRHPENDIVIDSPSVASFHAVLDHRQKPYRLILLSQQGETLLDGRPLSPNVSQEIQHWDTLEIDGYRIMLLEYGAAGAPSPPVAAVPSGPAAGVAAPPSSPGTMVPVPVPTGVPSAPSEPVTLPVPSVPVEPTAPRPVVGLSARPADQNDEVILTELSEREWTLDVDQTVSLQVTIGNGGAIVASFQVHVEGLNDDWVTILPAQVNLNEGQRERVTIAINPPRMPASRAGMHHFAVVVTSPNHPDRSSRKGATLTLNPYYDFGIGELSPKQQSVSWFKQTGQAMLPISNKGNSDQFFRLDGTDDERACSFEFQVPGEAVGLASQAEMRVAPEEMVSIPIGVTPLSRRLFALRKRTYPFNITTTLLESAQMPRTVLGQLKSAPLIGFWHLLLMLLLLMSGVVFLFIPGAGPQLCGEPSQILWDCGQQKQQEVEATDNQLTLFYNASRFAKLKPAHVLNRVNGASLGITLDRKLVGAPDNTYEVVEAGLKRPNGPVSDAPTRSVVYRLRVDNWLSLLIPRLAREATYLVTVGEVFPLIQVLPEQTTVEVGELVTLSWETQYADRVVLKTQDGLVLETFADLDPTGASDTYEVEPETDVVYIFEAHNLYTDDNPVTANAAIDIFVPPPVISFFVAQPNPIIEGTPVLLTWRVTGADTVSIESDDPIDRPIDVGPDGPPINRQPTRTTLYTLKAVKGEATAVLRQEVGVTPAPTPTPTPQPPVIEFFTISPDEVVKGDNEDVQLAWSVTGDTTNIEINEANLGKVAGLDKQGTLVVTSDQTTVYILTASYNDLSTSATVQLKVVEPTPLPPPTATPIPKPVIKKFQAFVGGVEAVVLSTSSDPKRIVYKVPSGSAVTLGWEVINEPSNVTVRGPTDLEFPDRDPVEQGFQSDPYLLAVAADGTFRLKAENESGSDTYFLEIKDTYFLEIKAGAETPPPAPEDFTYNGSGNFTWSYNHVDRLDGGTDDITGFKIYRTPHHLMATLSKTDLSWNLSSGSCVNGIYYIVAIYDDEFLGDTDLESDAAADSWHVTCNY
jgi:hypothetical protein